MASQQGNIERFVTAVERGQHVVGERFDSGHENETPWWNQGEGPVTNPEQSEQSDQPR